MFSLHKGSVSASKVIYSDIFSIVIYSMKYNVLCVYYNKVDDLGVEFIVWNDGLNDYSLL